MLLAVMLLDGEYMAPNCRVRNTTLKATAWSRDADTGAAQGHGGASSWRGGAPRFGDGGWATAGLYGLCGA